MNRKMIAKELVRLARVVIASAKKPAKIDHKKEADRLYDIHGKTQRWFREAHDLYPNISDDPDEQSQAEDYVVDKMREEWSDEYGDDDWDEIEAALRDSVIEGLS